MWGFFFFFEVVLKSDFFELCFLLFVEILLFLLDVLFLFYVFFFLKFCFMLVNWVLLFVMVGLFVVFEVLVVIVFMEFNMNMILNWYLGEVWCFFVIFSENKSFVLFLVFMMLFIFVFDVCDSLNM